MDALKQALRGSESRDEFKQRHKRLSKDLYACDLDFVFVTKEYPPGIVAVVDYKRPNDKVTFSEVLAYSDLFLRGIPVYIVTGDAMSGQFNIDLFVGGNHLEPRISTRRVARTNNWGDFEDWERGLRITRKEKWQP